jgi:signal recognition particle subunit SRP54
MRGSGRSYQEVNQLTQRFEDMRSQMKTLMGLDESQLSKIQQGKMAPPMARKVKKGKGKGKGNFRF